MKKDLNHLFRGGSLFKMVCITFIGEVQDTKLGLSIENSFDLTHPPNEFSVFDLMAKKIFTNGHFMKNNVFLSLKNDCVLYRTLL